MKSVRTLCSSRPGRTLGTVAARPFSSTRPLRHKESESERDHADVENHKRDLLNKHAQGKAEWKRELASDSEEAVKADKGNESIEELQEKTKKPN